MNEKDVRAVLGRFLFVQDDVKKVINDLSGGEKARLQLALLMLERNNVLILDEPTNHLDIDSKEMLEQALLNFDGTLLFVSHDRYFINQLANKVFDLDTTGGTLYLGDYQYYVDKLEETEALKSKHEQSQVEQQIDNTPKTNNYIDQKQQKKEQRQITRKIEQCELAIEDYEAQIDDLNVQLTKPEIFSNPDKANDIAIAKAETEQKLEQVMSEWAELQELLQ